MEVNILAPFLVPLCMQECELSFETKFKADIPTRRGDLGDPPLVIVFLSEKVRRGRGEFLILARG